MTVNFNSLFRIDNEEVIDFETFRKDILPQLIYNKNNSGYIFRGQSDVKYELLPSILRKSNNDLKDKWGYRFNDNNENFIRNEIRMLCDFVYNCNYRGLLLENIPKTIKKIITRHRVYIREEILNDTNVWISDEFKEIAALAQHYGMPTRLLDWTFSFNTSLYFATKDLLDKKEKDTFSIWIMNYSLLSDFRAFFKREKSEEKEKSSKDDTFFPLTFIIPEYAKNPNINAQKGILSLWEVDLKNIYDLVDTTPLDVQLIDFIRDNYQMFENFIDEQRFFDVNSSDLFLLNKYNFSSKDCNNIMRYLNFYGVDTSSIFPGYSGVIEGLRLAYKYFTP